MGVWILSISIVIGAANLPERRDERAGIGTSQPERRREPPSSSGNGLDGEESGESVDATGAGPSGCRTDRTGTGTSRQGGFRVERSYRSRQEDRNPPTPSFPVERRSEGRGWGEGRWVDSSEGKNLYRIL